MVRCLGHGALHQLDLQPLPRALEQASRGLDLLATGAQLPKEYREIQETRRDEEQRALAAKTGIIVSRFTSSSSRRSATRSTGSFAERKLLCLTKIRRETFLVWEPDFAHVIDGH